MINEILKCSFCRQKKNVKCHDFVGYIMLRAIEVFTHVHKIYVMIPV